MKTLEITFKKETFRINTVCVTILMLNHLRLNSHFCHFKKPHLEIVEVLFLPLLNSFDQEGQ